jgi:hypothetical protein
MSDESLRQLAFAWFRKHLAILPTWYNPSECLRTARFLASYFGEPYGKALARMLMLNVNMVGHSIRSWHSKSSS